MAVNNFQYDSNTDQIYGLYNEYMVLSDLDSVIRDTIQYKKENTGYSLVNELSDIVTLTQDDEPSINSFFSIMGRTMNKIAYISDDKYDVYSKAYLKKYATLSLEKRLVCIELFIAFAKQYVNINVSYYKVDTGRCKECGAEVISNPCKFCGLITNNYLNAIVSSNVKTSDSSKSKVLTPYDKFEYLYLRYKGKSGLTLPEGTKNKITQYISTHYTSENIDLSEKYYVKNVLLMQQILVTLKLIKHIPDILLICNQIWGIKLLDIDHLDEIIKQHWHSAQEVIDTIKTSEKISTIGFCNWRVWRHLNHANHEVDYHIFNIKPDKPKIKTYEGIWKTVCDTLKWDINFTLY